MEQRIRDKFVFFKFALVELVKQTIKKNPNLKLDLLYTITFDKLILYPFFLSTANGKESRETMFRYVFTDFKANEYGLYEIDINNKLSKLEENEFDCFKIINLNDSEDNHFDKIILNPDFDQIDYKDTEYLYNSYNLDTFILINETIGSNLQINYELIQYLVENILKKHPYFLTYSLEDLNYIVRNYYKSWKTQRIWVNNTDFDQKTDVVNDYRYKIFTNEDYLVTE